MLSNVCNNWHPCTKILLIERGLQSVVLMHLWSYTSLNKWYNNKNILFVQFIVEYTQRKHKWCTDKNECSPVVSKSCLHQFSAGLPNSNRDGCGWNQATLTKHLVWTVPLMVYDSFTKYFILTGRCVASWVLISPVHVSGVGECPNSVASQLAIAMESFLEVVHGNVTPFTVRDLR